jgi:predicted MFS family arabinose efflux permease
MARVRAVATLVRVCVVGVACCVLMLAATRSAPVALAAFVIIGTLSSLINVIVITAFQTAAPSAVRGRVMALVIAVSTAAVPLGMGLGGVLGALWGESLPLVFAGCGVGIVMLVAAVQGPGLPPTAGPPAGSIGPRAAGPGSARITSR